MRFPPEAVRWDAPCDVGPDGHWQCWFDVRIDADALRPLGLHPDQPTAAVNGPSPPGWRHAEAERLARRH
ncbi:hypothetical protein [Kitasatospora cathayae]|uniref:Uncharacterized protein n=1 Tax=Kitasatospora cathayae TaxID=3004092 RepID=A0ABY7QD81_9ACTN|nr:hypothetical protein [Kitasatospora sp. HUAS 3-15]WBP90720.1 hypothetical protein O1G21_35870 [Kitasatospora sp. HUAS 3-15]